MLLLVPAHEGFIGELSSIDARAAGPVALEKVPALDHKVCGGRWWTRDGAQGLG